MKKSSLVALALAACAFSVAAQTDSGTAPRQTITGATREVATVTAFRHLEPITAVSLRGQPLQIVDMDASKALPLVALLRADQYALRQIDRQRPEVTPAWRECPSV